MALSNTHFSQLIRDSYTERLDYDLSSYPMHGGS